MTGEAGRRVLDNRRESETIEFNHALADGLPTFRYRATCSRFPDGTMAEIFLNAVKIGTDLDVNARDAGIAASLALQYGCPIATLQRALLHNENGAPAGPLGAALALLAIEDQGGGGTP